MPTAGLLWWNLRPLKAIFRKHLASTPLCIARMMPHVQKYDAQIKYAPVKDIPVADDLSRISSCHGDAVQGLDACKPNNGGSDTRTIHQGYNPVGYA